MGLDGADDADLGGRVRALDTTSREGEARAWRLIEAVGAAVVPHMLAAYPDFRTWQGRASLVYHAIPHARTHEAAFALGLAAANDRAKVVRYRAISLLAYSLNHEAVPLLTRLLEHPHAETAADAAAAIDAITSGNHHYFHDRTHSGMITWRVQGG